MTNAQDKRQMQERGCANCGQPHGSKTHSQRIEIDHIVPISQGGSDNPENLQPLCRRCNTYKAGHALNQLRPHQIPNHPDGFDWQTLTWVEWDLAPDDADRLRQIIRSGGSPMAEFYEANDWAEIESRRIRRDTQPQWIWGSMFDVPVRPHEAAEVAVALHATPQPSQISLGREK